MAQTALERRESLYRQVVDEYSQHQIEHRNEVDLLNGEIRRLEDELDLANHGDMLERVIELQG